MITINSTSKKDKEIAKALTVLYVEDDYEILQQLSLFLKKKVRTLYTTSNGQEGYEAYKKYKPDVVITDIRIPTLNGLKMAEKIRATDKETPIIVTTAFNEPEYLVKSISLEIDRYVTKPSDPHLLLNAIVKSATAIVQKREIASKNRYIHFILDANQTFMIATTKNDIEYINKSFLSFLEYASFEDFKKEEKKLEDFFLKINGMPNTLHEKANWLEYMTNNPGREISVYFSNRQYPNGNPKTFLVRCNKFTELDSYLFSFNPIYS